MTISKEDGEMIARAEAVIQLIEDGKFYDDYDRAVEALGDLKSMITLVREVRRGSLYDDYNN